MSLGAQVSKCTPVWDPVFSVSTSRLTTSHFCGPVNQVERAISVGGGVKFLMPKRVQLRIDFRAYMTPLPNQLFRPVGLSVIHGWLYDFVPLGGISYLF